MAAANIPGWEKYRNLASTLPPGAARPQGPVCTRGKDCCIVAKTVQVPPRYAVFYDGLQPAEVIAAQAGFTQLVYGPETPAHCGAWMAAANIPGWDEARDPNFIAPGMPPPLESGACIAGQNCCYVGAKDVLIGSGPAMRTEYALFYDGRSGTGLGTLINHGFQRVVHGPVSVAACHAWANANVGGKFERPGEVVSPPGRRWY